MIKEYTNAVAIKNLEFGYDNNSPLITIHDWQLKRCSQTFLYGPSGSGKSTLLNLLCGILTPQKGEVSLLEQPFSTLTTRKRDTFRARHIGVVFQEFNLIPFLTIWENIELATHFSGTFMGKKQDFHDYARQLCERLKLREDLLKQRADTLSVGQRQRVSIVRALVNRPEILIADEPTSALDAQNRDEFIHLLLEVSEQSECTTLFVSHDRVLQNNFSHHQDINHLFEVGNAS